MNEDNEVVQSGAYLEQSWRKGFKRFAYLAHIWEKLFCALFLALGFALAMHATLTRTAPMFHRHVNLQKSPIGGEEGALLLENAGAIGPSGSTLGD